MVTQEKFTCFPQLLPETKSLVIDQLDNMLAISLTNKECYTLVQTKQIDYIISMHDAQNPSLAQFNIPPFIFLGTPNDFGGKYAISPNSRIFYSWTLQEKYFTQENLHEYKKFHWTINWKDPYKYIEATNLLMHILKKNLDGVKGLLAKHYKVIPEESLEDQVYNRSTKEFLMYAYYTAKKLELSGVMTLLEEHAESEKIDFKKN